jgi:transposase-like protein
MEHWVKNGKTADGRQSFYDTINKKSKLSDYKVFTTYEKFFAISLKLKGLSFRAVADIIGCSHPTIINWFNKFYYLFYNDFIINNQNKSFDDVEIDELFTFIKKKRKKFTSVSLYIVNLNLF